MSGTAIAAFCVGVLAAIAGLYTLLATAELVPVFAATKHLVGYWAGIFELLFGVFLLKVITS